MDRCERVAIVGVGLIGGSVGRALRARGLAREVVGVGRDRSRLDEAVAAGAIDAGATDPAEGLAGADVVVVCTPVSRIAADCLAAARLAPEALLTDAGSTKAAIAAEVAADPDARARFCGAHPIAGSERQGVAHSRADLLDGRACVIAPGPSTPEATADRVGAFWAALGCRVLRMTPEDHDRALALTSHLPHASASALAAIVPEALHPVAAGAFRDGTRVAAADPGLWADILLANRREALAALSAFDARLALLRAALEAGDGPAVASWWREGKSLRDRFRFDPAPAPPGDAP